jgi:hypothetical protein
VVVVVVVVVAVDRECSTAAMLVKHALLHPRLL